MSRIKLNIFVLLFLSIQLVASKVFTNTENSNQNQNLNNLKQRSLRGNQDDDEELYDSKTQTYKILGTEKVKTLLENQNLQTLDSRLKSIVFDKEDVLNANELSIFGYIKLKEIQRFEFEDIFKLVAEKSDGSTQDVLTYSSLKHYNYNYIDLDNDVTAITRILINSSYCGQEDRFFIGIGINFKKKSTITSIKTAPPTSLINFQRVLEVINNFEKPTNTVKYRLSFIDEGYNIDVESLKFCYGSGCLRSHDEAYKLLMEIPSV